MEADRAGFTGLPKISKKLMVSVPNMLNTIFSKRKTQLFLNFIIVLSCLYFCGWPSSVASRRRHQKIQRMIECNPYEMNGYSHNLSWIPSNRACPPSPDIFARLVQKRDVTWLRNRTVVFVGDSQDRNAIMNNCKTLGWQLYRGSYYHAKNQRLESCSHLELGCPWICTSNALNFTFLNFFHPGLETDTTFMIKELNIGRHFGADEPLIFEDRVEKMLVPMMNAMGRVPDMIVTTSAAWDLVNWGFHVKKNLYRTLLTRNRMDRYHHALATRLFPTLVHYFPRAKIVFRTLPECSVGETREDPDGHGLRPIHINAIRAMAIEAIHDYNHETRSNIQLLDWYKLIQGQRRYYIDDRHPGPDGNKIYMNAWLFFLKQSISN